MACFSYKFEIFIKFCFCFIIALNKSQREKIEAAIEKKVI